MRSSETRASWYDIIGAISEMFCVYVCTSYVSRREVVGSEPRVVRRRSNFFKKDSSHQALPARPEDPPKLVKVMLRETDHALHQGCETAAVFFAKGKSKTFLLLLSFSVRVDTRKFTDVLREIRLLSFFSD